jgi:hypothetical protein
MMFDYRANALPRKVLLFSGHMIDAPGRKDERFPPYQESTAANAIAEMLDRIGAGPDDLAICGGACGGDLLFAEAALSRNVRLELYIPFDEQTFLANSIDFADADWRSRFFAAKRRAILHIAADALGPSTGDPYERNNLRMLESAIRFGPEKIEFICLWNGQGGDGAGGTQHLKQEVQCRAGRVHWLDTRKLWL